MDILAGGTLDSLEVKTDGAWPSICYRRDFELNRGTWSWSLDISELSKRRALPRLLVPADLLPATVFHIYQMVFIIIIFRIRTTKI